MASLRSSVSRSRNDMNLDAGWQLVEDTASSEPRQLMLPSTWWFCQAGQSMMPSAEVRRAVFFL
jgi:hypothetical protein